MSDDLGAGFFALSLLAGLAGLADLLAGVLVVAVGLRGRTERVPRAIVVGAIVVLALVVLVAGFGVLALYDEAVPVGVLLLVVVFVPLKVVAATVRDRDRLGAVRAAATVGLAWSLPFLAALVVTFGLTIVVNAELQLVPPGRERAVVYLATAFGGAVAVGGSLLLGGRVSQSLTDPATA
jgi:hypothetical protein